MFQSAATVLIEPEPPKVVTSVQDVVATIASEEYYGTQFKLIKTRAVIERAIERLRLKERMPWLASVRDPYKAIAIRVG